MSTADSVIAALETVTGEHEIRTSRDLELFASHVLDSLRTIELVVELTARFHTDIALTEVDREVWATPDKIIKFMEHRVGV